MEEKFLSFLSHTSLGNELSYLFSRYEANRVMNTVFPNRSVSDSLQERKVLLVLTLANSICRWFRILSKIGPVNRPQTHFPY